MKNDHFSSKLLLVSQLVEPLLPSIHFWDLQCLWLIVPHKNDKDNYFIELKLLLNNSWRSVFVCRTTQNKMEMNNEVDQPTNKFFFSLEELASENKGGWWWIQSHFAKAWVVVIESLQDYLHKTLICSQN